MNHQIARVFRILILTALICIAAVSGCAEQFTLHGITADTEDTAIDFGKKRIGNVDKVMEILDRMPNLVQADMYAERFKRSQVDMLHERYPQIRFGMTLTVGDHLVRTDATAFSTLHGSDPDPSHPSKTFEILKYCDNLQALDIGHNCVEDLNFLRDLPNLKLLIVAVNYVTDLTPLTALKELEYLELFTNNIRDITPLKELTNLRDLNLKHNPIKDMSVLFEMTWLERLWVGQEFRTPPEQLEQLYAALPDCEIDWTNNPTEGTWRKHLHYDTIYKVFNTGVYEPFSD
ncbi:MAG: leucine-rich repeat domain-containing protein [Clostridia bacterium]|nr:leucine-rich repeat domain-containing protein [Clostridia bacterium]